MLQPIFKHVHMCGSHNSSSLTVLIAQPSLCHQGFEASGLSNVWPGWKGIIAYDIGSLLLFWSGWVASLFFIFYHLTASFCQENQVIRIVSHLSTFFSCTHRPRKNLCDKQCGFPIRPGSTGVIQLTGADSEHTLPPPAFLKPSIPSNSTTPSSVQSKCSNSPKWPSSNFLDGAIFCPSKESFWLVSLMPPKPTHAPKLTTVNIIW